MDVRVSREGQGEPCEAAVTNTPQCLSSLHRTGLLTHTSSRVGREVLQDSQGFRMLLLCGPHLNIGPPRRSLTPGSGGGGQEHPSQRNPPCLHLE